MPKPVCVKCAKFYRPKQNGCFWMEGMPEYSASDQKSWVPYKLWHGDLWACEGCGSEIIVGHGRHPIRERHHFDFKNAEKDYPTVVQVDDC